VGLNKNLRQARMKKNDEFYTRLEDIENELRHYRKHFKDKVVYCNCDDPRVSNFFKYFSLNFNYLGLKKLIATCYQNQDYNLFSMHKDPRGIKIEYNGDVGEDNLPHEEHIEVETLEEDGDFRSEECIEFLKEADIVVTNPPFSLFREYIAQLIEYDKSFLIIGNHNAITYKEVFPLIKENKMWLGVSPRSMSFKLPNGEEKSVNACWFTNLEHHKRNEELILFRRYNEKDYPKYANFDAIEVNRTSEIPEDYEGYMGVPITFLSHYNPAQFELIGTSLELATPIKKIAERGEFMPGGNRFYILDEGGKYKYRRLYDRIVIRNKKVRK